MEKYIAFIRGLISPQFLESANLELRNNKSQVKSLVISSPTTPYRESVNNLVFAKIKAEGKSPFIGFRNAYYLDFLNLKLEPYKTRSDMEFCRMNLEFFYQSGSLIKNELSVLLNKIFSETMSFPTFGCCSRYNECSNARKCIHPDQMYATACDYRKNLESGKVFYGTAAQNDNEATT